MVDAVNSTEATIATVNGVEYIKTTKPEDAVIEKPEDAVIEKPEDATTEKPEDTSTEKPEDAITEKPEDAIAEKPVGDEESFWDTFKNVVNIGSKIDSTVLQVGTPFLHITK